MPLGFCNVSTTFQRFIKKISGTLIDCGVLVYLYHVLFYEETLEKLMEKLFQIMKLLANTGLKCIASKCALFTQKLHYFEQIVSKKGIHPEPAKLK